MVTRRFINEIEPEQTYSISRAACYLGVHRCTIYAYINHPVCPLPFIKVTETGKLMFNGSDLIAYKASGLPKRGRKRRGCVKTLAQPFSIIYSPVIFSFVYAAFFSFIW